MRGYTARNMRTLMESIRFIEDLKNIEKEIVEDESLDSFSVQFPVTYRGVCFFGAIVFTGISAIGFLYKLFSAQVFEWQWFILTLVFALPCFILALRMKCWKIEINKKSLMFTGLLGSTKEYPFEDIDRLAITDQKTLVLYTKGKKLASIDSDCFGWGNVILRCVRDGIPFTAKRTKPLTNGALLFAAMKPMIAIFSILFFLLEIPMGIKGIYSLLSNQSALGDFQMMLFIAGFCLVFLGLCLILPLQGFFQIQEQERALGISFIEDMKKYNICGPYASNKEWFISTDKTRIIALKRKYVASMKKIEAVNSVLYEAVVLTSEGNEIVVKSSNETLKELKNWIKK